MLISPKPAVLEYLQTVAESLRGAQRGPLGTGWCGLTPGYLSNL
jgi:hypothetical protein